MHDYTIPVVLGVTFGTIARLMMMRTDYRQYPTYPQGRIIHITLGFMAASIGAVAIPSILSSNWAAVTFLGLAAQQFRDVRNMERNSLQQLDSMELVPRGASYIEGIAQAFEGRNYLVMFTSIVTTLVAIELGMIWAVAAALVTLVIDKRKMTGKELADIADIEEASVRIEGPNVYVDTIYIMNIGLKADRKLIAERGIGMIVKPKNFNSIVTVANLGQRQAMLHDISAVFGVYRDSGEPALVPLAKRDMNDGRIGLLLLPQQKDADKIKRVLQRVLVLDSAIRLPGEADKTAGR
ncbi:YIEGIA family protein [Aneurinibacillus terranovensis]|uniref:YIEGIA family protein n=1 Tax=Aneurinibacillus terranovensis TaxID=278991 RepID=UPI000410D6D4|nr:YIEGIA family protein [Aneurinibacillus terranovensis]